MQSFIKISKYAGTREDLVQAGGGNSSVKISNDTMYIKASGQSLTDISENTGYATVNPSIIRNLFFNTDISNLTQKQARSYLAEAHISGDKPSIETFLHSLSGKYTLHTHPVVVNALCCRKNAKNILRELFPDSLVVPYKTPGIELAKAYYEELKANSRDLSKAADVVFFLNHGLLVSEDSADLLIEKMEEVLIKIEKYLNADYTHYHNLTRIWKEFEDKLVWKVTDITVISTYKKLGKIWNYNFCPDCVVFLGKKPLLLQDNFSKLDIDEYKKVCGDPVIIEYQNELYILADSLKQAYAVQSVLSFSAQVYSLNQGQESVFLPEGELDFLLSLDEEKYRTKKI